MPVNKTITPDLVQRILGMWNISPDHVSLIKAKGNTHWRVQRGREDFILRMYRQGQTGSSIRYELDILRRLHDRGWPVAADVDGVTWREDSAFVLFPLLLGCLDDLWRASVLRYALHLLENESITGEAVSELEWRVAQLERTQPFQGWRVSMSYVIEIVPYDPIWPARFAQLGGELRAALGTTALRIDHIGSTSIPGLAAKPIIDIQISVAAFAPTHVAETSDRGKAVVLTAYRLLSGGRK